VKTALVTGVSGQDGSYLAQHLLRQGYHVVGCVRDTARAAAALQALGIAGVELRRWDPHDQASLGQILSDVRPQEVYNLAAFASGAGMFDDPVEMGHVNGLLVARWLQAIHQVDPAIRFCQASSSEMFGDALASPQSEATPMRPRTPYGAAKQYGHAMVQIYRQRFGLFACSAILFNHESPRRGLGFVTRKITHQAARIKLGLASGLCLGDLGARRDWGHAADSVRAMWLMLQQALPDNYVVSTGQTHSVRELCEIVFGHLGLDYREHVSSGVQEFRAPETVQLVGDPGHARATLGWAPTVGFAAMLVEMVEGDLAQLSPTGPDETRLEYDQSL